jgi:hypothetical protein
VLNVSIAGAFVFGALYLAGVFAAGLIGGNHAAVVLALLSAGLAYLCQCVTGINTLMQEGGEHPPALLIAAGLSTWAGAIIAGGAGGLIFAMGG